MLGKVYGEILESDESDATEALLRDGSSMALGVAGGGGLGQQMENSMKMLNGGEVPTMLAVFVALVALVDALSYAARRSLTR